MRMRDRLRRLERLARPAEAAASINASLEVRREALAQLVVWQHAQVAAGAEMPPGLPALVLRRLGFADEVQ